MKTGVHSAIFVPLSVGGSPIGTFGMDTIRRQREWSPELVPRLKIVGEIFANALTRRRAEARQKKSDAQYRQVLESTNAIPWETDGKTWKSTYVGPQAEKLLGYPVDQWYQEDFWVDHIHPDDRVHAVNYCLSSAKTCDEYSFEYRMVSADGRIVWFHDFVTVFKKGGEPRFLRGLMVDVTERKRAELLQAGFKRVLEMLAHGEGLSKVLNLLVRNIDDLQTGMRSSILLLDPDGKRLLHTAGPNLPEEYNRTIDGLEIGPGRGSCGTAAYRGELVVVTDTTRDPLWRDFRDLADRFDLRACWSRPIISQAGEVLGTFAMYHQRPYQPTPADLGLVEQAAYLAGVAIERTRAREKLQQSEAALRRSHRTLQDLAGKLLTAQEEERRHLARELHDDLTQRLAAIAIEAGKLEQRAAPVGEELTIGLGRIRAEVAGISEDVHDISRRLHPSILEDLGLVDAIASECRTFSDREGIAVEFSPENVGAQLPRELSICLYRVVQEGLRNIAKHSRTETASVALHRDNGQVRLTIRDSGIGFDKADLKGRTGLGLASMKERVRLIEGRFSVSSRPGQGTTIDVRAPLIEVER
jgi:PAS domain S-box-containing protein